MDIQADPTKGRFHSPEAGPEGKKSRKIRCQEPANVFISFLRSFCLKDRDKPIFFVCLHYSLQLAQP
jgi:hypothetical protein